MRPSDFFPSLPSTPRYPSDDGVGPDLGGDGLNVPTDLARPVFSECLRVSRHMSTVVGVTETLMYRSTPTHNPSYRLNLDSLFDGVSVVYVFQSHRLVYGVSVRTIKPLFPSFFPDSCHCYP